MQKEQAIFYKDAPKEYGYSGKHCESLSKRLAKKCKHEKMVDDSYGGPESGCMAGHCAKFSFHHTLY